MFDDRGLRPLRQLKMVAIVRGIDFGAVQTLSDVHQQQRFGRALVTLHADMRHAAGRAFGQVEKYFRLNRGAQALAVVVYLNLKAALRACRSAQGGTDRRQTPGARHPRPLPARHAVQA